MIDIPPEPPFADEQVITQRLLECGLAASGFTVRYEDELQSIEVVITPSAGVTAEQFPCIHTAVFPEIVTFENRAMYQEYMAYVGELFRPQMLADTEAALRERGLWEGFPERDDFPAFADYVRALEAHASVAPGTALRAEGDNRLVFDPPRLDQGYAEFADRYSDLLTVATYAAAKEDLSFGFIGNEKIRE
jgi:hypothetical protein